MSPGERQSGKLVAAIESHRDQALELLDDSVAIAELLEEARAQALRSPPLQEKLAPLWRLVDACNRGDYQVRDAEDLALALAAVMYVASPWDLSPDYLPSGLHDDLLAVTWVSDRISEPVAAFEEWDRARRRRVSRSAP